MANFQSLAEAREGDDVQVCWGRTTQQLKEKDA